MGDQPVNRRAQIALEPGMGLSAPGAGTPLRFGVLLRLGKRYYGARPALVALYVLGSLVTVTLLPVAVAMTYSEITNFFQSYSPPGRGSAPGAADSPGFNPSPPGKAEAGGMSTSVGREPTIPVSPRAVLASYWLWVALVLGGVLAAFGHRYMTVSFDGKVANAIRSDVFANLLRQSPRFFHQNNSDQLTVIVNQFCIQAQMALRQLLIDPFLQLTGLVIVGFTLFNTLMDLSAQRGAQVWGLFSLIAAFALISPGLVRLLANRLQHDASAVQQQHLASATLVGGALAASEEVQAMRAEPFFTEKYHDLLVASLWSRLRQSVSIERLNALNVLPGNVVLVSLIGLAIYFALTGVSGLEPGTIVALGLLTPQFMSQVQSLSNFTINASLNWPPVASVNDILESEPEVIESPDAREIDGVEPIIEARDVVFSYKPGALGNILDGVSFRVCPAEVTGLIARPGRGKTTFFRLALRFYEPQHGQIVLGDVPVTSFTLDSLRRHVTLMSQSPAFFFGTVRENFRVAKQEASDDDIRRLCEITGLWSILESNLGPNPLDQQFAAGKLLSGGQKKLFALTRCLLLDPTVLLLDEPTVGMGPLEKFPLIKTMRKACAGKTVIVVDHDIVWQVRFCDRFLVLDGGKIVQQGTSEELLAVPGLFRELYHEATQRGPATETGPRPYRENAGARNRAAPLTTGPPPRDDKP